MNWLRRIRRWLTHSSGPEGYAVPATRSSSSHIWSACSEDNPDSITVTVIRNGFLLSRRTTNRNGPDKIEVDHVANVDELGPKLAAMFVAARFTK